MIDVALECEEGIEGRNGRSGAEGRRDDAAVAGGVSRPGRAAPAAGGSAKPALRGLDDGGVDAVGGAARFGAQNIGLRNGEVIAEVGQIEVVLDGQSDGVLQRKVDFSVADQGFQTWRITEVQGRRLAGPVL